LWTGDKIMSKKIIVAVTGGIAAYKAPSVISGLKKATNNEIQYKH